MEKEKISLRFKSKKNKRTRTKWIGIYNVDQQLLVKMGTFWLSKGGTVTEGNSQVI